MVPVEEANRSSSMPSRRNMETKRFGSGWVPVGREGQVLTVFETAPARMMGRLKQRCALAGSAAGKDRRGQAGDCSPRLSARAHRRAPQLAQQPPAARGAAGFRGRLLRFSRQSIEPGSGLVSRPGRGTGRGGSVAGHSGRDKKQSMVDFGCGRERASDSSRRTRRSRARTRWAGSSKAACMGSFTMPPRTCSTNLSWRPSIPRRARTFTSFMDWSLAGGPYGENCRPASAGRTRNPASPTRTAAAISASRATASAHEPRRIRKGREAVADIAALGRRGRSRRLDAVAAAGAA